MPEAMPHRAHVWNILFGRLTLDSLPFLKPDLEGHIVLATLVVVLILGVAILGLVTRKRLWGHLWREWFTSVDHKKLGRSLMVFDIDIVAAGQTVAYATGTYSIPPKRTA
jgi:cytochrome o ubiquinol oxidase subunit 1